MSALRARSRWWWGMAVLVVLAAGCASAPASTPRTVEASTLAAIEEASEARRSILKAAVRAEAAGAITSEQMESVAAIGRKLDTAILTTGRALEVYLTLGAPANRAALDDALAEVKRLKAAMKGAVP